MARTDGYLLLAPHHECSVLSAEPAFPCRERARLQKAYSSRKDFCSPSQPTRAVYFFNAKLK